MKQIKRMKIEINTRIKGTTGAFRAIVRLDPMGRNISSSMVIWNHIIISRIKAKTGILKIASLVNTIRTPTLAKTKCGQLLHITTHVTIQTISSQTLKTSN